MQNISLAASTTARNHLNGTPFERLRHFSESISFVPLKIACYELPVTAVAVSFCIEKINADPLGCPYI
jgi:hypothetical protein